MMNVSNINTTIIFYYDSALNLASFLQIDPQVKKMFMYNFKLIHKVYLSSIFCELN